MSLLQRLFGDPRPRAALEPLYRAIVAAGRDSAWYCEGGVPDTLDGRFDMVAALTALVLLRLETEGDPGRDPSVLLTEIFIDDMDGTLRQIGIGDYVVGKHLGRMVGALGGRLAAFRDAAAGERDFVEAVRRNLYRDAPPSDSALAFASEHLGRFADRLGATSAADLVEGRFATS